MTLDVLFEHWLLGFIEGEGTFNASVSDMPRTKKPAIQVTFTISQKDHKPLHDIQEYFKKRN